MRSAALVDLHLRQVDAHHMRLRMPRGEWNQIAPAEQPISNTWALDTSGASTPKVMGQ